MDTQALRRIASQIEDTMPDSVSAGVVINAANKIDELRAELEAKDERIADAPHGPYCQSTTEQGICDAEELCDCWKKEASDEDAR